MATSQQQTSFRAARYWSNNGVWGLPIRVTLRTSQFVLAMTVIGLYSPDLVSDTHNNRRADSLWVYATMVGSLSALICIVHCFVTVTRLGWWTIDWVLFILWTALFGSMGSIYIGGDASDYQDVTQSVTRMKVALWFDLLNMLLWLATGIYGMVFCVRARRSKAQVEVMPNNGVEHGLVDTLDRQSEQSEEIDKGFEKEKH
ncbi:hypothetical protein C1H76_7957 [Elsinoe australis]|uniref:MARVEL domain-containing protein n=1 Tax=Elsinoe australis TaxID=40998 RepID=A0A4U7APC7_9PEZI|nr:hypothetical protein C1H76_7957 [Elsinoe australis]